MYTLFFFFLNNIFKKINAFLNSFKYFLIKIRRLVFKQLKPEDPITPCHYYTEK